MRKIIILVAGVAACAPGWVFGTGFGSFVSSFKSPGPYPAGVSYRPGYLYISTQNKIVWRTTTTGSIISYHPTELGGQSGITVGAISGKICYWVANNRPAYVYRFVDNSSTVAGSFPAPGREANWRGVTFVDKEHMYYTEQYDQGLYLVHPVTGSIYSSYKLAFKPNDLAYDDSGPGYLWITSSPSRAVYKCTLAGSAVASFSATAYEYLQGCGFDGEYLWVGCGDPTQGRNYIVQFDVRSEPAVAPASLGRVKALYR
jgi:hypothetical protein